MPRHGNYGSPTSRMKFHAAKLILANVADFILLHEYSDDAIIHTHYLYAIKFLGFVGMRNVRSFTLYAIRAFEIAQLRRIVMKRRVANV